MELYDHMIGDTYRIHAMASLLRPWANSLPPRTASNTRRGSQSYVSLEQPLFVLWIDRGIRGRGTLRTLTRRSRFKGQPTWSSEKSQARGTVKGMSRQFRKAYEYARACARGRPPRPKERIYLCNWYVKLVKPGKEIPNNQVQCHVPMK